MIATKDFFVGFHFPKNERSLTHGMIYFRGIHFANLYRQDPSWGNNNWVLNRDVLALHMGLPVWQSFITVQQLLNSLQEWINTQPKEILDKADQISKPI
jgi:hypothetical protein